MTKKKSTRARGGKLARSQTVTVRLDPRLRYLAELAARKQRRTLSSFIEWAIEESLKGVVLKESGPDNLFEVNVLTAASKLWDVDDADRFVRLASSYPELLTHDEQRLWKLIRENGYVWRGVWAGGEWTWDADDNDVDVEHLREHWDDFNAVARGDSDASVLPDWQSEGPLPPDGRATS